MFFSYVSMLSKQLDIAVHLLATQLIQESPACLSLLLIFRENQKCNCITGK